MPYSGPFELIVPDLPSWSDAHSVRWIGSAPDGSITAQSDGLSHTTVAASGNVTYTAHAPGQTGPETVVVAPQDQSLHVTDLQQNDTLVFEHMSVDGQHLTGDLLQHLLQTGEAQYTVTPDHTMHEHGVWNWTVGLTIAGVTPEAGSPYDPGQIPDSHVVKLTADEHGVDHAFIPNTYFA